MKMWQSTKGFCYTDQPNNIHTEGKIFLFNFFKMLFSNFYIIKKWGLLKSKNKFILFQNSYTIFKVQ